MRDKSIPGFAELSDWPIQSPALPFRIGDFGAYRDPQPFCTFFVELIDASGQVYAFFFDRALGRLCYGQNEDDENAAYLRKNSTIQIDVFAIIHELCANRLEYDDIASRLAHASNYA